MNLQESTFSKSEMVDLFHERLMMGETGDVLPDDKWSDYEHVQLMLSTEKPLPRTEDQISFERMQAILEPLRVNFVTVLCMRDTYTQPAKRAVQNRERRLSEKAA